MSSMFDLMSIRQSLELIHRDLNDIQTMTNVNG